MKKNQKGPSPHLPISPSPLFTTSLSPKKGQARSLSLGNPPSKRMEYHLTILGVMKIRSSERVLVLLEDLKRCPIIGIFISSGTPISFWLSFST